MPKPHGVARNGRKEVKVFTVGHSNVHIDVFLKLLRNAQVDTVIDCRSKPRSRWPQFGHSALARHLVYAEIRYEWRGNNIGGYPGNVFFHSTLDEIRDRASDGERIALVCSEGKPEQCHRGVVLAPELEQRGCRVEHLLYE